VYLLYDLALILSAVWLVPRYLLRGVRRGTWRQGLGERFGIIPAAKREAAAHRRVIWIHAVSVGETRAAAPLIQALGRSFPDAALVLSSVTESGQEVGRDLPGIAFHCFFPFDLSWVVGRVLETIRPALVIMVETEIWPNFVRAARRLDIPVALVNGRISDRSYPRYRMLDFLLRRTLDHYSIFCMQTEEDVRRIRSLGASAGRVSVTGNLKFDMLADHSELDQNVQRDRFRLARDAAVWTAGSTHEGEEETLVEVFRSLLREGRPANLVLAPRHPSRAGAVAALLERAGLEFVRRSRLPDPPDRLPPGAVLLVDSFGEMLPLYVAADVVFVGGSLAPVGGHNLLEAAVVRRPVLFGPHVENFRDIADRMIQGGAGRCVSGADELLQEAERLFDDPEQRRRMGENGLALVLKHAGATERILVALKPFLDP